MARARRRRFSLSSLGEYIKIGLLAILETFKRFPLTLLLFISLSVVVLVQVETSYDNRELLDLLNRLIGVHIMAIAFSLAVETLLERLPKKRWLIRIIIYLVELVLLADYFQFVYTTTDYAKNLQLGLLTAAFLLVFLFVPYFYKKDNYEVYINKILTHSVVSIFFAVVIGLGLSATVLAVQELIYASLRGETYAYVWTFAMLIFAPVFLLAGIPKREEEQTVEKYNKVLEVLVLYIMMPLLVIYTAVLYIYFAQVLITQEWPRGIVSYLVVSYTAVGILIIFLANSFRKTNRWARYFTNGFNFAVIPLLGMMFAAIGLRINQYGFTENRYFIVLIGAWSLVAVVFYIVDRGKNNVFLPLILALFLIVAAVGPFSASNVSLASQSDRFYKTIEPYDILEDGVVAKTTITFERVDQKEIVGTLEYIDRYHDLSEIEYLPAGFEMSQFKDYFGFERFTLGDSLVDWFEYYRVQFMPIIITDYDVSQQVRMNKYPEEIKVREFTFDETDYRIIYGNDFLLKVIREGSQIYQNDFKEFIYELYDEYADQLSRDKVSRITDDITFIDENEELMIFCQINSFMGRSEGIDDKLIVEDMDMNVYIKIKDR